MGCVVALLADSLGFTAVFLFMTDDPRVVLKHKLDKVGWQKQQYVPPSAPGEESEGAGSSVRHKIQLFIRAKPEGEPLFIENGSGSSMDEAEKRAAEAVLNSPEFRVATEHSPKEDAWLGDATLKFLLALLGAKHKLSPQRMHDISKELFSNEALSLRETEAEFGAVWTRATQFEARVGAAVRTSSSNLEQLLESALQRASPELLDALQAKVGEVQSAL